MFWDTLNLTRQEEALHNIMTGTFGMANKYHIGTITITNLDRLPHTITWQNLFTKRSPKDMHRLLKDTWRGIKVSHPVGLHVSVCLSVGLYSAWAPGMHLSGSHVICFADTDVRLLSAMITYWKGYNKGETTS